MKDFLHTEADFFTMILQREARKEIANGNYLKGAILGARGFAEDDIDDDYEDGDIFTTEF